MTPPPSPPRPFVLINMAMSADGKIATANRQFASLGSPRDHHHLLALRATADAVLCGARTADLQPVNLGPGPARFRRLRRQRGLAEYNLRVIASGSASLDPGAEVFRHTFSPIILLVTDQAPASRLARLAPLTRHIHPCGHSTLDLPAALHWLHQQWGVRRLLCEGGGALNFALIAAGLVDELHLTICPCLLGGRHAPSLADGPGFPHLHQAPTLQCIARHRRSHELFLTYRFPPNVLK